MHPSRRYYLNALGLESWVRRGGAPGGSAEAAGVAAAAADEIADPAMKPKSVPAPAAAAPTFEVPRDWAGLRAMVKDCRRCRLCETRTQTVFGVGPENAPLMVVGEGPGADEDAQGEPFVGRAGKLLDEMLKALGRSRKTDTFIANVVKCRPPNNREPAPDEAESCRPYLEQQLRLVKPMLIVALGRVAAQRLLVTDTPLSKLRGALHHWGPEGTPLMVTYHPAYLLRNPGEKAKSWQDLKAIDRFLAKPA
ncbi:MAG: uracil-DNA glycosylase [Gammaproteobacteria bacterium]|nr:uracil-DNA glycosylase [Gammaproteobacteria bacterium]